MNKQLSRLLLSHSWAYFVALALCILAAVLLGQYWLAAGEALLTVLLAVLNLLNLRRRRRAILQFIEHAAAQGQTMAGDVRSMPLPMAAAGGHRRRGLGQQPVYPADRRPRAAV